MRLGMHPTVSGALNAQNTKSCRGVVSFSVSWSTVCPVNGGKFTEQVSVRELVTNNESMLVGPQTTVDGPHRHPPSLTAPGAQVLLSMVDLSPTVVDRL